MVHSTSLRVVVATPLSEQNCQLVEQIEPRVEMVRDQSLYPPMRHPADFAGDPDFRRSATKQRQFDAMVDSAEALFGIPDVNPAASRQDRGRQPAAPLGAHDGRRRREPGQGRQPVSGGSRADRIHHVRRCSRRPVS